ncbi:MAG: DUF2382 domain-containing protein [Archangium sp.]|nr:DUF2382 domain-containing protein [Archangium sp.]
MRPTDEAEQLTVPVVQETVEVGRHWVDTGRGVRIDKRVTEREEEVDTPLMHEELTVERIPIDRIVSGPEPQQHYEGETLVVPVLEEVLVLEKRLRLKEEVRITRRQRQVHQPQRVSLKSEEVSVERFDEKTPGGRHG